MRKAILCVLMAVAPALVGAAGCGGGEAGASDGCLETLDRSCDFVWGSYQEIYDNLFQTCGAPGTGAQCHAPAGAMGGLVLADPDGAYNALLGVGGDAPRVAPFEPECSVLVKRLLSDDPSFQMPPGGGGLSEAMRCSVVRWVADGATR